MLAFPYQNITFLCISRLHPNSHSLILLAQGLSDDSFNQAIIRAVHIRGVIGEVIYTRHAPAPSSRCQAWLGSDSAAGNLMSMLLGRHPGHRCSWLPDSHHKILLINTQSPSYCTHHPPALAQTSSLHYTAPFFFMPSLPPQR